MAQVAAGFGDLLREFRTRAGFSQSELAEKANISEAAIGSLERGVRKAPHRNTVALLARALALTDSELAALESARFAARKPSVETTSHNIEPERTSFVGREADVEHLLKLLRRSRLVTVTGSGGVGKSRLALETGLTLLGDSFPAVWFVALGPLIDGDFIAAKIAQTIQPPLSDHGDSLSTLLAALNKRHMLLILDNCEHLVAQVATIAEAIMEGCPQISILATSRERLNVAGEFVYRLPSLLLEPAIDLFAQRARSVDAGFLVSDKALPLMTDIARRLGGIPLALELTAAQASLLGIEALHAGLERYLGAPSGRPDLPARQRTVIATIEWSYNLLTPEERALLCEASVFVGGFTLAGVKSVCDPETFDRSRAFPLIASLVNKSLVNAADVSDSTRYTLLDTVRSFGSERLRESGRHDVVSRRHAEFFATIADQNYDSDSTLLPERAAELAPEFDDVRAAVVWSLNAAEPDDRALAGRILKGLFGLWDWMGRRHEHLRWIETALDRIDEQRHPLIVSNLLTDLMTRSQTQPAALEPAERAVRLCERSGDKLALANLYSVISQVQAVHGKLSDAELSVTRSHDILTSDGLENSTTFCGTLLSRSFIRFKQGRLDEARDDLAHAERIAMGLGRRYTVIRHYYIRKAEIEYFAGNVHLALDLAQQIMDSEYGADPAVAANALPRLAVLRLLSGNVGAAVSSLRELLILARDGYGTFTYIEVEYAALALALLGRDLAAAKLLGAVLAHERRVKFRRLPMRQDAYNLLYSTLRSHLSDEEIDRAAVDGENLTTEEIVNEAIASLSEPPP